MSMTPQTGGPFHGQPPLGGYPGPQGPYGPPPKKNRAMPWVLAGLGVVVVAVVLVGGLVWPGWFTSSDSGTAGEDQSGPLESVDRTVGHTTARTTQVAPGAGAQHTPTSAFFDGYEQAVKGQARTPSDFFCATADPSAAQVSNAIVAEQSSLVPHSVGPEEREYEEPGYTMVAFAAMPAGNSDIDEYVLFLDDAPSTADPGMCVHHIKQAPGA